MKLSTDRILTTHVGSLPRPQPLVAMLIKKDRDERYDPAAFEAQVKQAVADIVARQVAIGIDIVSDGEASKVGYATYVHERLTGFSRAELTGKPITSLHDPRELVRHTDEPEGVQEIDGFTMLTAKAAQGDVE